VTREGLATAFKVTVVVVFVIQVGWVVWMTVFEDGGEPVADPPTAAPSPPLTAVQEPCGAVEAPPSRLLVNDEGGYGLEVPPGWEAEERGSVVTLTEEEGRASLSVGVAPRGGLTTAIRALQTSLDETYEQLSITSARGLEVGGCPARALSGQATNDEGAGLFLEAIVVAGPRGNHVVAGFVDREANDVGAEDLRRIAGSILFIEGSD
jgi:hypothetical protein